LNRIEAGRLLLTKLAEYRGLDYEDLASRIGTEERFEIVGPSGSEYQLEVLFLQDDPQGGAVRVMGSIDDGGWRAFCPLCDSFAVAHDGTVGKP